MVIELNEALFKVLGHADIKSRFASAGSDVKMRSPQDFAQYVATENEKWEAVIKKGGIKLD